MRDLLSRVNNVYDWITHIVSMNIPIGLCIYISHKYTTSNIMTYNSINTHTHDHIITCPKHTKKLRLVRQIKQSDVDSM